MHKHIRKVAATIAILLCSTQVYAAQKSRATLQSDIITNLASNKPITAADLRAALADIADSAYITLTDTTVLTTTSTSTLTNKTISGASNTISNLPSSVIVSGTFAGARGGTNNAFFEVTGPTTSTKTFTFPNATATVLTTDAAVTVAQGGTGASTAAAAATNLGLGTTDTPSWRGGTFYYSGGVTTLTARAGTNSVAGTNQPVFRIQNSAGTTVGGWRGDGLIFTSQVGSLDDYTAALIDNSVATSVNPRGLNLGVSSHIGWGSAEWWSYKDTSLTRVSAGVLGVGLGSATPGTTTGAIRAATVGTTNLCNVSGSSCKTQASLVTNREYCYGLSDQSTNLATGTAKVTTFFPSATVTVNSVRAYVNTAPTGSTIIVDINEAGSTIMSATKLSIDASEKTSGTAASAAVLSDTSLASDAEITFDIDQVGSTIPGKGLVACLNVSY